MRRIIFSGKTWLLITAVAILLGLPWLALAQAGFLLDWFTVDGGGGLATGGSYSLHGSIGQPDAGTMSGGSYSLSGGFWSLPASALTPPTQYQLFLPVVIRQ